MSGCDGACCVAFYLNGYSMAEFEQKATEVEDGEYILDMLIPLTADEARERAEEFGTKVTGEGPFFTCRHFNDLSRRCMAYEARPRMCSRYPYARDGGCEHGCSCVGSKKRVYGTTVPSSYPGLHRVVRQAA